MNLKKKKKRAPVNVIVKDQAFLEMKKWELEIPRSTKPAGLNTNQAAFKSHVIPSFNLKHFFKFLAHKDWIQI